MTRRFYLVRNRDVTGKSGTGIIGEGIVWRGGSAALHWVTDHETFVHWPGGIDAILAVHGHEGATVVRWLDAEPEAPVEPQPSNEHPLETFDREDRG